MNQTAIQIATRVAKIYRHDPSSWWAVSAAVKDQYPTISRAELAQVVNSAFDAVKFD